MCPDRPFWRARGASSEVGVNSPPAGAGGHDKTRTELQKGTEYIDRDYSKLASAPLHSHNSVARHAPALLLLHAPTSTPLNTVSAPAPTMWYSKQHALSAAPYWSGSIRTARSWRAARHLGAWWRGVVHSRGCGAAALHKAGGGRAGSVEQLRATWAGAVLHLRPQACRGAMHPARAPSEAGSRPESAHLAAALFL